MSVLGLLGRPFKPCDALVKRPNASNQLLNLRVEILVERSFLAGFGDERASTLPCLDTAFGPERPQRVVDRHLGDPIALSEHTHRRQSVPWLELAGLDLSAEIIRNLHIRGSRIGVTHTARHAVNPTTTHAIQPRAP